MRILLLPSLYIPNIGGIETFTKDLAVSLIAKGHSVTILTKKWPVEISEKEEIDGIKVYRIFSAKTELQYSEMNEWLKKNVNNFKADIVHVIGVRRCLPVAGLILSREMNIPIIMTIAGSEVPERFDPISAKVWNDNKDIIINSCKSANAVTSFSIGLKNNFEKVVSGVKIDVLYAGIDLSVFSNIIPHKHKKNYIISARRLSYDKGVDILIDAYSKIYSNYDIDLIIAGEGPELENLKHQTKKLNLVDRVKFLGSVSIDKLAELLSGAILTVVPSRCEGGGLINIEAQAAGCPVIASDVGGISEYVADGYSGLLVPSGNSKDLSAKIEYLLNNESVRLNLIKNGKDFSSNFDFNFLVEKYVNYYKSVIDSFFINSK